MFRGGGKASRRGGMRMEKIACRPSLVGGEWILNKVSRRTMKSLCQQGEKNRDSIRGCTGCARTIPQALGLQDLSLLGD